jgi:WD repeat-containing protein 35
MGRMVIWAKKQNKWVEEMVNEAGKKQINDVKWSKDESKITILIEDGQVIVGSVHGDKLWAKTIEKVPVFAEWSPDGKYLLIGTQYGEVMVWETTGNYLFSIKIQCLHGIDGIDANIEHVVVPE